MSFTAGALLLKESVRIAEQFVRHNNPLTLRKTVLEENLLQTRSQRSSKRLFGEIVARLEKLTKSQLQLLITGSIEDQRHILWLGVCKRSRFIWDFAIEVVREHYLQLGQPVTRTDYEAFYNAKVAWHPKLDSFSKSTQDKLRQNLFKMLREAGLLSDDGHVIGALLSNSVFQVLVDESVDNLMVFPIREQRTERQQRL
jgi:hypothetical protein